MMGVEQSVEWEFARETEVLGENLLQCHFVHHESHMTWARTQDAAVGSRRLTAWAMAFPILRCNTVLSDRQASTFRKNLLPPTSGYKIEPSYPNPSFPIPRTIYPRLTQWSVSNKLQDVTALKTVILINKRLFMIDRNDNDDAKHEARNEHCVSHYRYTNPNLISNTAPTYRSLSFCNYRLYKLWNLKPILEIANNKGINYVSWKVLLNLYFWFKFYDALSTAEVELHRMT
jgi:hypothetical protein